MANLLSVPGPLILGPATWLSETVDSSSIEEMLGSQKRVNAAAYLCYGDGDAHTI